MRKVWERIYRMGSNGFGERCFRCQVFVHFERARRFDRCGPWDTKRQAKHRTNSPNAWKTRPRDSPWSASPFFLFIVVHESQQLFPSSSRFVASSDSLEIPTEREKRLLEPITPRRFGSKLSRTTRCQSRKLRSNNFPTISFSRRFLPAYIKTMTISWKIFSRSFVGPRVTN